MKDDETKRMAGVIRDMLKEHRAEIISLIDANLSLDMENIFGSGPDTPRIDLQFEPKTYGDEFFEVQDMSAVDSFYGVSDHLRRIERHGNPSSDSGTSVSLVKTEHGWKIDCLISVPIRGGDQRDDFGNELGFW